PQETLKLSSPPLSLRSLNVQAGLLPPKTRLGSRASAALRHWLLVVDDSWPAPATEVATESCHRPGSRSPQASSGAASTQATRSRALIGPRPGASARSPGREAPAPRR